METTNAKQLALDVHFVESDLLHQAAELIEQAMLHQETSSVRKFEFLIKDLGPVKLLQLLQAAGNTMYLRDWDNILVESNKAAWKMHYYFKHIPD